MHGEDVVVTGLFVNKRRIWQYNRLKKIYCNGNGLRQASP